MADYPSSLPVLTDEVGGDADSLDSPSLPDWALHISQEVEAIAAELGVSPSAAFADVAARLADIEAGKQPLDDDLTAIAAVATTAYGRDLLSLADAAAGRTTLGLGTAAVRDTGTGASQIPLLSGTPGTPDGTKFLRDDGTWAAPSSGGSTLFARKTANEDVTSSATLQDDNHLFLGLSTNKTYAFECVLFLTAGSATPDYKVAFTVPAGSTVVWGGHGLTDTAASEAADLRAAGSISSGGAAIFGGVNPLTLLLIRGLVRTAGTAGNLQLQWAQNVSSVDLARIATDSHLIAREVA